jgi:thioredoxin-related protein
MCFYSASAQDTTAVLGNTGVISNDSIFSGEESVESEYSTFDTTEIFYEEEHELKPWEVLDTTEIDSDTIVNWYSIESAMELQKATGKKIFIEVYATWCKWCRAMDDSVFRHKEIAHYLNQNYIAVKFNCESRLSVFFKGKEYRYLSGKNEHVHELALYLNNNKQSYPSFAILNVDGNMLSMKQGYLDLIAFENYLNFYGSNAYIEVPYQEFEARFAGRIRK